VLVLSAGAIDGCGSQPPPQPAQRTPEGMVAPQPAATPGQRRLAVESPKCVPIRELPSPPRKVADRKPPWSELRKTRTHGGVLVYDVVIGTSGSTEVKLLERRKGARPSARIAELWRDAIREWKFEPTVLHDKVVPVCMTVTVTVDVW